MTASTDQFAEITTRTQEALTAAVRTWADILSSVAGSLGAPALPDAAGAVDRCFDLAQQVLDNQRTLATTVLTAGTHAAGSVTEQVTRVAQTVGTHTANAAETAVGTVTDAVRVAGEKAAGTVRAARNVAKI